MKAYGTQSISRTAGFTLVEILIVIAVIISLMGIVMVAVMSAHDPNRARVNGDFMLLSDAIERYKEAYGNVLPLKPYYKKYEGDEEGEIKVEELPQGITIRPSPTKDEERVGAWLFYLLTRSFESTRENDPGVIGRTPAGRGPFLSPNNLAPEMLRDPSVLDEEFEKVNVEGEYEGTATWFVDPWGTPYRYTLKNDGMDFNIESAGPDGEFGDEYSETDERRKDNITLEALNR